ncbi:hypothetical protein E3N88_27548 [Mikania micrantha]|uniref:Uncharacterized protein n=1 Tax=Mikania micrantha TaxID=192012 RepID=A0A5N6MY41_9ASTR|nr:hypothetical protein E3N88_27548 [Mikania micrantha]
MNPSIWHASCKVILELTHHGNHAVKVGISYYDSLTCELHVLELWEDGTADFPLIDMDGTSEVPAVKLMKSSIFCYEQAWLRKFKSSSSVCTCGDWTVFMKVSSLELACLPYMSRGKLLPQVVYINLTDGDVKRFYYRNAKTRELDSILGSLLNAKRQMPAIGSKLMTAESSLMIDLNSSWNGARPGRRCLRVAPVLVQSRRMALLKRMKAVCMDDMTVLAIRGCNVPGRTTSELVMNRWKSLCRIQLLDDIMVVSSIGMQ